MISRKISIHAVDHDILLRKLRKYGVLRIEFEWFMSYLTDRKQSCTLSGENSSFKIAKCGNPQGSCLIYINDLPSVLGKATPSMFADGTSMWVASDSVPELLHLLRDEITLLEKWMCDNKLTLNTQRLSLFSYHPYQNFGKLRKLAVFTYRVKVFTALLILNH